MIASARNQFHFTETIYLCLRSLRGLCIVARDSWANSPKGGDAKPPVYGTWVPMTAGLPARTLTPSGSPGHAARPDVYFGRPISAVSGNPPFEAPVPWDAWTRRNRI